jgi:hypothetical protein
LSSGWAFRVVGAELDLRHAAEVVRVEWVYVDAWMRQQGVTPTTAAGEALVRQLQEDAIWIHPVRPTLSGDWLDWFEN